MLRSGCDQAAIAIIRQKDNENHNLHNEFLERITIDIRAEIITVIDNDIQVLNQTPTPKVGRNIDKRHVDNDMVSYQAKLDNETLQHATYLATLHHLQVS